MKILYVCFAIDQNNTKINQITSDSPAAFVKVSSVCAAINTTGNIAKILSLGIYNSKLKKTKLMDSTYNNVHIRYIHNLKTKIIRNFYSIFILPKYIKEEKPDVVIFYNYAFEYINSINYCRKNNIKFIIDIEDGVNKELNILQYNFRNCLYNKYIKESGGNVFTVSKRLTQNNNIKNSLVIYGTGIPQKKIELANDKINFLFCGTIIKETGAEYLISAINKLSKIEELKNKFFLNICGFGNYDEQLIELQNKYPELLKFWGKVDRQTYTELIDSSDCGVVLRVSETSMAQTTFPSKIVELSLNNLGLITTPASDIPLLFNENEVYFVNNDDDVVEVITKIVNNREEFNTIRNSLFEKACLHFDMNNIGKNIINFIGKM